MPLVPNGSREEEDAAGDGEEALVWDTGLSQFLGRLEEDLIRWHSEERVKAKERQLRCLRAQKDLVTVEASIRETAAAQRMKGSEDDPWLEKMEAMLRLSREQREEMRQLLELVRSHVKLHMEHMGSALLAKMPPEGSPPGLASDELSKQVQAFLDLAERQAQAVTAGGASRKTKGTRKEKRKGGEKKDKKSKGDRGPKERQLRDGDDDYSYLSSSRSPSFAPRRRERRGCRHRRERYTPSCSYSDSRSCSFSPTASREAARRPRPARRGGGPGAKPRGGGGPAPDRIDIPAEVDRFVRVNKLEGRCEKILRELSPALARRVMGLSGGSNTFELSGDVRDPTAVVLARIRKAREDPRRRGGPGHGPAKRPRGPQ